MSLQARARSLSLVVEESLRGTLTLGLLEAEATLLGAAPRRIHRRS